MSGLAPEYFHQRACELGAKEADARRRKDESLAQSFAKEFRKLRDLASDSIRRELEKANRAAYAEQFEPDTWKLLR